MPLNFRYSTYLAQQIESTSLCILGSSGTSNNLDQLASNDSLSGTVEKNGELADHVTGVLRGVVHGVTTGRLFASVTLCKRPVERVGESVLSQVTENLVINLERGEVCCNWLVKGYAIITDDSRDAAMASSEKASMKVGS